MVRWFAGAVVRWCVGTAAHDNAGAPDRRVAKVPRSLPCLAAWGHG